MSATKNVKRSKQARGMNASGALPMTRGSGPNSYTYYDPSVIENALEKDVGIRVIVNGKSVLTRPRRVHRNDLTAIFGEPHEDAGNGKYIQTKAVSGSIVTGANNVNPYLATDGSYATTITALQSFMPKSALSSIKGDIKVSRGWQHIVWRGRKSQDDAVLVGEWVSGKKLWERALKLNPGLKTQLRDQKSQVSKDHLGTFEKFLQNIDVMRRARAGFNVATGTTDETRGGATPYAMPLEQCGFAIDKFFLTTGFDSDGNEVGEYFYRLAVGRDTPWSFTWQMWNGSNPGTKHAYLTDALRQRAIKQMKKSA